MSEFASGSLEGWTIAFDLDGTLIDTAPDLIATANVILERYGFATVDGAKLRPMISFGSRRILRTGIAHQPRTTGAAQPSGAVPDHQLDEMFEAFLDHYRANIAQNSTPFPHLPATLEGLRARGATLAVCTNKLAEPAAELLRALALDHHFAFLAGRDTFPVCKPDPGHLLEAIRSAGGTPDRAVMVGDSDVDVATAKAARVPVIGVTFGYTPVPVTELGCQAVIETYADFAQALQNVLRA